MDFLAMALLKAAGQSIYLSEASVFDGSNDWLSRTSALSGVSNSSTGILSVWIKLAGSTGGFVFAVGGTNCEITATTLNIAVYPGNASKGFRLRSADSVVSVGVWTHILASWNMAFSAGNKIGHMYLNGSDALIAGTKNDFGAGSITANYNASTSAVGAATSGGSAKFSGEMSEFYFAPGQFLDFSVSANRSKFRTVGGKPANLGATGNLPTGTAPAIYLKSPAASFNVNSATGGNYTLNGSLGTGTPP